MRRRRFLKILAGVPIAGVVGLPEVADPSAPILEYIRANRIRAELRKDIEFVMWQPCNIYPGLRTIPRRTVTMEELRRLSG